MGVLECKHVVLNILILSRVIFQFIHRFGGELVVLHAILFMFNKFLLVHAYRQCGVPE